jgi:hypothetical protein
MPFVTVSHVQVTKAKKMRASNPEMVGINLVAAPH